MRVQKTVTRYENIRKTARGGKREMKLLLTLDQQNYTEHMPVFEKYSTRAIIIRNGKIATQKGSVGDYKLLGGGVEAGEDLTSALIREVREESGLVVLPGSIQEIGEIVERRRDIFEPDKIFVCHSCFFFCDAEERTEQTHMTESEQEHGYHLEWALPEEIISGNEPFFETQPWSYRDSEFIRMLPKLAGERRNKK